MSNTTTIGQVNGPVHTGSGDLNVQTSVSIDVLVQKLEAVLAASGASPEKKRSVLKAFGEFVREAGIEIAAKFAAEMVKPG